jgi:hypothetical protein
MPRSSRLGFCSKTARSKDSATGAWKKGKTRSYATPMPGSRTWSRRRTRRPRGRPFKEYRARADDGEGKRALGRYRAEIDRTATVAMVLARTHGQEPVAIDALRFVVKAAQARQNDDRVIRAKPNHQSDTLAKMVEDLLDERKAKSKP